MKGTEINILVPDDDRRVLPPHSSMELRRLRDKVVYEV